MSVFVSLYLVGDVFNFNYLNISVTNYYWIIVLAVYILFIGSVFEMYNLQVASNQYQVIKSIILTSSTTVLVYLLTPIYTPFLPSKRLEIFIFFFSVFGALFIWRMIYVRFFASNRFVKKVILVCDQDQAKELVEGLTSVDPHYRVLGFVNSDSGSTNSEKLKIKSISIENLAKFVRQNSISEIVVASQKTDGITVSLYNQLIILLEKGYIIREYTQVYEAITHRIPVQYVSRDFYRYFPFSRSNQNHLYLLIVRILEILMSLIGLSLGILLLPIILIGNFFGNRGKLFYTQERVGKNGEVFNIVKFRTMVKNAEKRWSCFCNIK